MKIKTLLAITIMILISGCMFTGSVIQSANPKHETYLVSDVPNSILSGNNLHICFNAITKKSKNHIDGPNLKDYIASINIDSLAERIDPYVINVKCNEFISAINNKLYIPVYIIERNVTCSIDKKCNTFSWSMKQDGKEILSGIYKKNPQIKTMSLHTHELKKVLKKEHKVTEAIYAIRGVNYTSDSNAEFSIYYRNENIPVHPYDQNINYIKLENITYGDKKALKALLPVTAALDIVTLPIQIPFILKALNKPYK